MLAQLLIQFQKPIVSENSIQNSSIVSINDTASNQLNTSNIGRNIRDINDINYFHKIHRRFVMPEHSVSINNGIPEIVKKNNIDNHMLDDVKNESIKNTFPDATSQSEKHDEFRLVNFTRAEFYTYFNHIWNDVWWLANLVVWMGFFGLLLSHHFDLRLQMVGARMRIACCSLMYRKVFHEV